MSSHRNNIYGKSSYSDFICKFLKFVNNPSNLNGDHDKNFGVDRTKKYGFEPPFLKWLETFFFAIFFSLKSTFLKMSMTSNIICTIATSAKDIGLVNCFVI